MQCKQALIINQIVINDLMNSNSTVMLSMNTNLTDFSKEVRVPKYVFKYCRYY